MKQLIVILTVGCLVGISPGAEERLAWPRFRGANGSGVADDQKPPVKLGPETNVKWKVDVPGGLSSPVVAGDRVIITAFENGKLYTVAYQRGDGKEAWRREAPATQIEKYMKVEGSPAASTPATDGRRIVSYFGSCGLFCYDLLGAELWRFPMPTAATFTDNGSGVSPIIADGLVVLVRDEAKGSRIMAVSLDDGALRWEKPRQSINAYCTPVIWDTPDGKQIVAAGHCRMIGYDLATGEQKWFVGGMPASPCPSPLVAGGTLFFAGWSAGGPDDKHPMPSFDALLKQADADKDGTLSKVEFQKTPFKDDFDSLDFNQDGKVTRDEWDYFLKSIYDGKSGAVAVAPGGTGDVSGSHLLWRKSKGLPSIPTAIVYRGQMVMVKDGGLVTAYDAKTGSEIYTLERVGAPGRYFASPVAANGNIYIISRNDGTVTVLKAGTTKPERVVRNPKLGERVDATPAIADDTMYVRTASKLYAFAENAPSAQDPAGGDAERLVGDWKGQSLVLAKNTPAKDETVVWHIRKGRAPGKLLVRADKIVHDRPIPMGTLEFAYDRAEQVITCKYPQGVWSLHVSGKKMEGTLTLPDQTVLRRVSLEKAD
jgi:outer membrane protein assembly factor BamB